MTANAPSPAENSSQFAGSSRAGLDALYVRAGAARWGLACEAFQEALERSVAQKFGGKIPSGGELMAYIGSLHLEDLALASACREGLELAWEEFVLRFRAPLERVARAMAGDARGEELVDALFAELYGLEELAGRRRSLFDYFHGRSKLLTWLRAVLAQRHVDELRRTRRLEPLDDAAEAVGARLDGNRTEASHDPDRGRYLAFVQSAVEEALAGLDSRDRLRLAHYYADDLTLAQIGRLLGEHEATVSRKLAATRQAVRERVERVLREQNRLSEAQVKLCYEYAREKWPFDLTRALGTRE